MLPQKRFASATTDGWTSVLNETYDSLTLHSIDQNFILKSYPFDIEKIDGHTRAEDLGNKITGMASKWDAELTVLVTDCEPSMVAAWRKLKHGAQGCFDHRLEKVSGIFFDYPGHKESMVKCRSLAGHYSHSTQVRTGTPHTHTLPVISNF